MLTAITERSKIEKAQALLQQTLSSQLAVIPGKYSVGFQGGKIVVGSLRADDHIWFSARRSLRSKIPRFWNAFGLTSHLALSRSNVIVVELNVALDGKSRQVAGLFARDESTGSTFLMHSGKVGGGKAGVGKQSFLAWYGQPSEPVTMEGTRGRTHAYLRIADLSGRNAAREVSKFVEAVARFKSEISLATVTALTDSELRARVANEKKCPTRVTVLSTAYRRSMYVVEFVRRRSNGVCALCQRAAPFSDSRGIPFLECHHIDWLRNGGSDSVDNAVAVCPNCHRKMHVVNDPDDVVALKAAATFP